MSPRARDIKERINKWDLIKIKRVCTAKENTRKMKREPTVWENILANDPQTRVWSPKYIKNSHDSTPGRQTTQLKNGQTLNRHFFKDIQKAQRHMKKCSSLALERCKLKPKRHIITHQSGWPLLINQQTTMLTRLWRTGNPSALLMGMQTGAATVENSMEFPHKTETGSAFWPSSSTAGNYTLRILKHQFKRTYAPQCSQQHYLQ